MSGSGLVASRGYRIVVTSTRLSSPGSVGVAGVERLVSTNVIVVVTTGTGGCARGPAPAVAPPAPIAIAPAVATDTTLTKFRSVTGRLRGSARSGGRRRDAAHVVRSELHGAIPARGRGTPTT